MLHPHATHRASRLRSGGCACPQASLPRESKCFWGLTVISLCTSTVGSMPCPSCSARAVPRPPACLAGDGSEQRSLWQRAQMRNGHSCGAGAPPVGTRPRRPHRIVAAAAVAAPASAKGSAPPPPPPLAPAPARAARAARAACCCALAQKTSRDGRCGRGKVRVVQPVLPTPPDHPSFM